MEPRSPRKLAKAKTMYVRLPSQGILMSPLYVTNSAYQREVNVHSIPEIEKAIDDMFEEIPDRFKDSSKPFIIGDLACANAINSIPVFSAAITKVRAKNPELPVVIYLVDLPGNDFTVAKANVQHYLAEFKSVLVFTLGQTMYSQVLQENSCDLIFCMMGVHWSTDAPTTHNSMCFPLTNDMLKTAEGQIWNKLAEQDWEQFLKFRETELKPNGRLVVSTLDYQPDPSESDKKLMKTFELHKSALWTVAKRYKIEQIELEALTLPIVFRCERAKDAFVEKRTTLELESFVKKAIPFRPLIEFHQTNNVEKFADDMSRFHEAWSVEYFRSHLQAFETDVAFIEKFLKEYYKDELIKTIKENLEFWMGYDTYPNFYLVAKKNKKI